MNMIHICSRVLPLDAAPLSLPPPRPPVSPVVVVCLLHTVTPSHARPRSGIVHRDVKLDNLLLLAPGDISQITIADFG